MPENLALMLHVVGILIGYGHHLLATLQRRAVQRSFACIARFFGTASVSVILAHVSRGVMRAVALQRVLEQRATRGRDLTWVAPGAQARRERAADKAASGASRPAGSAAADGASSAQPANASRVFRRISDQPLTLDTLPEMAQLEAEVRRRPIGRSVVDICRDIGVAPLLCDATFGNQLFVAIRWFRGSLNAYLHEMRRRERSFEKTELDRSPAFDWPENSEAGIRSALGFLVGETPQEGSQAATPASDPRSAVPPPDDRCAAGRSPRAPVIAPATGPP